MGTFKDGDERLSDGGASCGSAGRGGGGGRRILADLVAHLSGDITQTLRHRLAPPETLNAPVQEADPAEQQVRVVAQRHEEDDDGDDEGDDAGQQLSSGGASADITPPCCLLFWDAPAKQNRIFPNNKRFIKQQPKLVN